MNTPRLAFRHYCSLRDAHGGWRTFHTARNGKPRSTSCTYCRGALVVETGLHAVFVHRGDGRYQLADAVKTFVSPAAAERFEAADPSYVVRWISVDGGAQ